MQYIKIPMSEVMILIMDPTTARINDNETMMLMVHDDVLHVLEGDFTGIDHDNPDMDEIMRRNTKPKE